MYKRVLVEGLVAVFPGIQRLLPVILAPVILSNVYAGNIVKDLSIGSVVVLVTAVGMINLIYSAEINKRRRRFEDVSQLYIYIFSPICVFVSLVLFAYGLIEGVGILPLWLLAWGGYQIYRSYLISIDKKVELVLVELVSLVIGCALYLFSYVFHEFFQFVPFLTVFPFFCFVLKEIGFGRKFVFNFNWGVFFDSFKYGVANLCSAGPMLMLPVIFDVFGVDSVGVVFMGLLSTFLSVAMLLNRILSNYYMPMMANHGVQHRYRIFRVFSARNSYALVFSCPFIYIVFDSALMFLYQDLMFDGYQWVLAIGVLSFFISQAALPISNLFVVSGFVRQTVLSNAVGFFSFVAFIVFLYLYDEVGGIYIVCSLCVSYFIKLLMMVFYGRKLFFE